MKELFDERSYESLGRIGRGQFAQVHRCSQPLEGDVPVGLEHVAMLRWHSVGTCGTLLNRLRHFHTHEMKQ